MHGYTKIKRKHLNSIQSITVKYVLNSPLTVIFADVAHVDIDLSFCHIFLYTFSTSFKLINIDYIY